MTEYKLLHVLKTSERTQFINDRLLLFEEIEMESEQPSYVCVYLY